MAKQKTIWLLAGGLAILAIAAYFIFSQTNDQPATDQINSGGDDHAVSSDITPAPSQTNTSSEADQAVQVQITDPDQIASEVAEIEAEFASLYRVGEAALDLDCEAFIVAVESTGVKTVELLLRLYQLPDESIEAVTNSQALANLNTIDDEMAAKAASCGYSFDDDGRLTDDGDATEPGGAANPGSGNSPGYPG